MQPINLVYYLAYALITTLIVIMVLIYYIRFYKYVNRLKDEQIKSFTEYTASCENRIDVQTKLITLLIEKCKS